jgi:RND family efflux transporter MFP subunit
MRKLLIPVASLVVLALAWAIFGSRLLKRVEIPMTSVRRGPMEISLRASGAVDAKRAYTVTAPRVRNIQITWMAPEGSIVKQGEPVIRFDSSQQEAELAENQSTLQINQASLERQEQELTIQEKQLDLELTQAQRNYDEMKHEAPKIADEARMQLELAELNARAKLDQIRSDVQKAELEVQRAKDKVAQAQRELDQMTLTAPIPGMVVYLEIWKGSSTSKVQQGDSPWPGQGLINLPDLSEMIVKAAVSEVDASQVEVGQEVAISLDAFPGSQFQGKVSMKGSLARRKEPNSKINVFDVEVAILDKDERLKPGMSASCRIIVDRTEEVLALPLEAVFEVEGKPTVYLENRKPHPIEVGRRTDTEIEVRSGLEVDQRVCLVDPRTAAEQAPGERATEPELNRGRSAAPGGGGQRGGGGRGGGRPGP